MRTFAELTADEQSVVKRQAADQILQEIRLNYLQGSVPPPSWLTPAEVITYNEVATQCRDANLSGYFFIIAVYATVALYQALIRESLARTEPKLYLDAGEESAVPIVGEAADEAVVPTFE